MKHKTVINLFICFSILLGHITVRIPPVHAAGTITVNSTSDNTTTDGLCTLREAIINANANFQSRPDCPAGSGADTIIFAESLGFTTIYLGSDLPSITDTTGLTIDGAHRIIIHGSNLYRPFYISFSVPLTLNKIFINNGRNSTSGGGVFVAGGVLTIINSQFNFNHTTAGGSGGALYISNGSAVISNTLFYNNTTNTGIGGAIYLDAGTLNISSSAFLNNSAFIGGAIYANSSIIISNTTFAYNETTISGSGGALSLGPSAAVSLYNNTLSQNTAGNIGGGGISINGATVNLYNNIVANNSPDDCNKPDPISVITGANNILENDNTISGCQLSPSGNIFSDPNLGAINSGYFPLNPGSPAINAGDDSVCAAAPVNNTSQNGVTRPQGAACDIGAYELPASDPSPTILSITRASTNPTSATSVDFAVVFSEVVTGVDVNDFSISKTGSITGASVTNVSGTGGSYTVTVNTGSGNGTIRLDVPNTATIKDLSNNDLSGLPFTNGETYTITKVNGISITIGGTNQGSYTLSPGSSQSLKYPVTGGPVVISSGDGANIIASLNQWRRQSAATPFTGVAQSMGLPVNLITDTYVIPRYVGNDPTLYNAILMANVDTVPRDITVTIGGVVRGTYTLAPSASQYAVYNGVVGGPVVVSSASGSKIVASLYELKRGSSSGGWMGQSEMMGVPYGQLSNEYLIPIYFGDPVHVALDARLFIANADTVTRDITVTIGGVQKGTYTLAPNTSQSLKYPVTGGPVVVSSPPGSKIIASLNQWRRQTASSPWTGVAQSMALPVSLITNRYVIPRYVGNDSTLYNAVLMANVDTVPRDITVTIGGVVRGTYTLAPSACRFEVYTGVVGGPVVVSSASGSKIVASLYELKRGTATGGWTGQSEMMGLPYEQLSDQYLIPIYFGDPVHIALDARLFIAVP